MKILLAMLALCLSGCAGSNAEIRALSGQVSDLRAKVAQQDTLILTQAREVSALQVQTYQLQQMQVEQHRIIVAEAMAIGALAGAAAQASHPATVMPPPSTQSHEL